MAEPTHAWARRKEPTCYLLARTGHSRRSSGPALASRY